MKFCEKCGNKLKEGYAFCDKCGTKVKEEEKKKEKEIDENVEIVEEKEEPKKPKVKEEKEVSPIILSKPPKSGKGMIVFLWILVVLLLASTITFLILWLTKSTSVENYSSGKNGGDVSDPTPTPDNPKKTDPYVGKWEQNVEYKSGNRVTQRTYGMIELKDDGTFETVFYDKDDKSDTYEEFEGTYKIRNDIVTFSYELKGEDTTLELEFKNDKLCLNDDCDDYLVKDGNNKITIYDDDDDDSSEEIKTITYSEYQQLQKDYEDAIVVVIKDGCSWCEKFESVVEEISEEYSTPVYYYEYDGKISVNGTPATVIIKNGYVVDLVEGYKEYSDMEEILDDLGVK